MKLTENDFEPMYNWLNGKIKRALDIKQMFLDYDPKTDRYYLDLLDAEIGAFQKAHDALDEYYDALTLKKGIDIK